MEEQRVRSAWITKRAAEREEMNRRRMARGIPREACLDPWLTAISEYAIDEALRNTPFTAHLLFREE